MDIRLPTLVETGSSGIFSWPLMALKIFSDLASLLASRAAAKDTMFGLEASTRLARPTPSERLKDVRSVPGLTDLSQQEIRLSMLGSVLCWGALELPGLPGPRNERQGTTPGQE